MPCIHTDVLGRKKGLPMVSSRTRRQGHLICHFRLSFIAGILFYHAFFFYPGDTAKGREEREENAQSRSSDYFWMVRLGVISIFFLMLVYISYNYQELL